MKIILYSFKDEQADKFKEFLNKNNLPFKEIIINNDESRTELRRFSWQDKVSVLKVILAHSIHAYSIFDEQQLNLNIIEHIKKYNARVEKWE